MDINKISKFWVEEALEALTVASHLYEKGDYSYAYNLESRYPDERRSFRLKCDENFTQRTLAEIEEVFHPMVEIDSSVKKVVDKFLDKLREEGISISAAYLFGSYARGKGSEWSDIDMAIISPGFSYDRLEERVRLMKLSVSVDSRIEPAPFRPDTFVDEDPLAWEIKRNGILIERGG